MAIGRKGKSTQCFIPCTCPPPADRGGYERQESNSFLDLMMNELFPVLPQNVIARPPAKLTQEISTDDGTRKSVRFTVLKCAFIFLSNFFRHLTIPEKVDFKQAVSYGFSS